MAGRNSEFTQAFSPLLLLSQSSPQCSGVASFCSLNTSVTQTLTPAWPGIVTGGANDSVCDAGDGGSSSRELALGGHACSSQRKGEPPGSLGYKHGLQIHSVFLDSGS